MARPPLKPIKRAPLLYHTVQEAIQTYIIEGNLKAGDALPPEAELARQLQVSRNSVREGVKALESVGILETRRGSGVFVKGFSFDALLDTLPYGLLYELEQLVDLLDIRRVLETGMIESSMETLTERDLVKLRNVVARMRLSAEQGNAFPEEDREFHHLLFARLDNKVLLELLDVFWLAFRKAVDRTTVDIVDHNPLQTYRDHALILDTIVRKDVEQARQALTQHYENVAERLRNAQEERGQEQ